MVKSALQPPTQPVRSAQLSTAQRSELRSQAHALNPVVIIGDAGLTPAVLKEIDINLSVHGLIKVRVFGDDREARIGVYTTICEKLGAAPIQHIGKLLVIYRPKRELVSNVPHSASAPSSKKGKGMREVTIVKPSASGTRRPSVTKVLIKGNERVTAGGLVKRVKPRQTSTKKSSAK